NLVGAKLAARRLMPRLYGIIAALALVLAVFAFTAHSPVLAALNIVALGAAGFATVPPLQTRVMDSAAGAPALASAANIGAFNLANAGGAFIGGLVIDAGFGYAATNWAGAALAATGLAVAIISGALDRRRAISGLIA